MRQLLYRNSITSTVVLIGLTVLALGVIALIGPAHGATLDPSLGLGLNDHLFETVIAFQHLPYLGDVLPSALAASAPDAADLSRFLPDHVSALVKPFDEMIRQGSGGFFDIAFGVTDKFKALPQTGFA